jgi:hypothetical protein
MKQESKSSGSAIVLGLIVSLPMAYWAALWVFKMWLLIAIPMAWPILSVKLIAIAMCIKACFTRGDNEEFTWEYLIKHTVYSAFIYPIWYGFALLVNYMF